MSEFKLTFKRGPLEFTSDRKDIMSVDETPDGITIKIQGGILLTVDDMHMPQDVKQRVAMADIGFKKGNLIFNLNDYRNPVMLTQ